MVMVTSFSPNSSLLSKSFFLESSSVFFLGLENSSYSNVEDMSLGLRVER